MRCEILKKHENEVRRYCTENKLSYNKLVSSSLSWGKDNVFVLHNSHDSQRERMGLLDDMPMPVTLEIYLEDGKLRFEQTDITHKYLGAEKDVTPVQKTARPVRPPIPNRPKLAYA